MPSGGLRAPAFAPGWLQSFAGTIEDWVEARRRGPQPLTAYSRTALPDAARHAWSLIAVSDGASNRFAAVSNGSAWYYLDGTLVT
ncbi:MAG: hypothetical protein SFV21_17710 [Rhodospirillaceae bacterium]|nr:hypothetical protein [Rhodospirillaceae bacterium]